MSNRSTFATAAMALSTTAQAQTYDTRNQPNYAYDPCKREKTKPGTMGALIGGAIGAVVGSNVAASGVRTEGSLLGGAAGAAIGARVGNSSAACETGQITGPPPPPPPLPRPVAEAYDYRYDRGSYDRDDRAWTRGPNGESYQMSRNQPVDAAGCTLAESPIYMPDGRTQTRFVRVCRDSNGEYQVVD